jgi:hypothetical protein
LVIGSSATLYSKLACAEDIAVADFARLKEADQLAYLKHALLEFRRRTANISATVIHFATNYDCDPGSGRIGMPLQRTGQREFDLKRIGSSYRVSDKSELIDPKPGQVVPTTIEGFDARTGLSRHLAITREDRDKSDVYFGIIDSERGSVRRNCFFYQYLGDDNLSLADFGYWFLKNFDKAKIARIVPETATVEVTFPHPDWYVLATKGTCHLVFDLNKGALLTALRFDADFIRRKDGSLDHRQTFHARMADMIRIDGNWIPTKLFMSSWDSRYPKQITIHVGEVKNIRLNQLTPSDLEVVFPPGTEVEDVTRGQRFRVGPDGRRTDSTNRRGVPYPVPPP